MRYVSFEILLKALENEGVDAVYERLSDLFMEDALYVIDKCGAVCYTPFDLNDLWNYLEGLYEKINKEVEL